MTHLHRTRSQHNRSWKNLFVMGVLCLVSACGSSDPVTEQIESSQNSPDITTEDQHSPEQNGTAQAALAMTGTIIIEERNGKTIFDAFFSHIAESASDISQIEKESGSEVCRVSTLQSDGSGKTPVELGAASNEADYAVVGAALTIESRVGQFEALIKQQVDDLTVYAPDERWQSVPLPDDAVLSFDSNSIFDEMGTVDVPPLLPLVWLVPDTGVMSNPAASLQWEASHDEQVQIKLRLSAIDFSDSQIPVVVTVACDVVDDGLFKLPVEFQRQLPDDDMGIVIYAVRERVQEVKVDNTSLTVVQLSYPAPVKP